MHSFSIFLPKSSSCKPPEASSDGIVPVSWLLAVQQRPIWKRKWQFTERHHFISHLRFGHRNEICNGFSFDEKERTLSNLHNPKKAKLSEPRTGGIVPVSWLLPMDGWTKLFWDYSMNQQTLKYVFEQLFSRSRDINREKNIFSLPCLTTYRKSWNSPKNIHHGSAVTPISAGIVPVISLLAVGYKKRNRIIVLSWDRATSRTKCHPLLRRKEVHI